MSAGDDGPEHRTRADVYSSARIGAAAALTVVVVVLLVLDVEVPDYDVAPGVLLPVLRGVLPRTPTARQVDVLAALRARSGLTTEQLICRGSG